MGVPVPSCLTCTQWNESPVEDLVWTCNAFPAGVPEEIRRARNPHEEPFPGDRGIQYDPWPAYRWRYEHPTAETAAAVLAACRAK